MKRRLLGFVVVIGAAVALIVAAWETPDADVPTFSVSASGWMPAALAPGGLTETWFCPGVPANGLEGVGGEVIVANRGDVPLVGTVLLINELGERRRVQLGVDEWSIARVDLDATLPGAMVGAVIEIDGGGAVVEQYSEHPRGNSVTPCANATSDAWYLADGFTVEGSLDQIVLTNPFEQTVVANLEFATQEGSRAPASYRGLTVPPESVRVVDLGAPGAGAQGEPILAVKVETSRGRLVVGRFQSFNGGGRSGTQVSLAVPALREQWWFTNGIKGAGVVEQYSIYNPTSDDVEVDPILLGIATPVVPDPILVPARQVVVFDPASVSELPEGRFAVVFSTLDEPSVVVERASTITIDDAVATSVIPGAPPRQDGYVATTWHLASGPAEPTEEALVIYNADNAEATVSIMALGASGPVPVESLQGIEMGAAQVLTIDLVDPLVIGRELIVESTSRVFIERSFLTGQGGTRSSSWALPAS